jgi:hypothetical protein
MSVPQYTSMSSRHWGLFRRSDPDDPPEVDWNALSARVVAFGSNAVADAFADGLPTGAPNESPMAVSFGELAALIRVELQGKGADEVV